MASANNAPASAVALAYTAGDTAPRVVAAGNGLLAEEILRRARAAGVPIHASRELVSLLMRVDLNQHIPPLLYRAVAELLVWLHQLERVRGERASPERR